MKTKKVLKLVAEKTKGRIVRLDKGNLLSRSDQQIDAAAQPSEKQRTTFNANVRRSGELVLDDKGNNRPLYWEYDVMVD